MLPRRLDVNVHAEQAKHPSPMRTAAPRPPQPASAGFCRWAWRFSAGRGADFSTTEYTVGQIKEQLSYGGSRIKKIASRPVPVRSLRVRGARFVFEKLISIVGLHHRLESTVFYLAQEATATGTLERNAALGGFHCSPSSSTGRFR